MAARLQDGLHILLKAEAEHHVRLVQNDELDHAQVQCAAVHQIHHASGRAHRHVHAAAQLPDLRPDVRACAGAQDVGALVD